MDTTLGKRIMAQRKKLGLTQDKLAETLGVTAQAVSKWENDQSCPDITMLPRLSELFGITTDQLLGLKPIADEAPPVLEGTVENAHAKEGTHDFQLKFEPGKRDALFIAFFVLFVGILTLYCALYKQQVSFWSILWPSAILGAGIRMLLRKFSFFGSGCTIFGGYFLLENMAFTSLDVSWKLIFPVLILLLGLSLFVDALRKPKHTHAFCKYNDKVISQDRHNGNLVNEYSADDNHFSCSLSFGNDYRQVNVNQLVSGQVDCAFGELTLDLCGCKRFAADCHLTVDCSFGSTTIFVPRSVQVVPSSSTAFAGLEIQGNPDADAGSVIHLEADVSFGSVTVSYV